MSFQRVGEGGISMEDWREVKFVEGLIPMLWTMDNHYRHHIPPRGKETSLTANFHLSVLFILYHTVRSVQYRLISEIKKHGLP